ncbi:MAG: hypothetical protein D6675_16305 [Gemmatimonadetes bacterium]|nr:MAG: hypothetical protein D6675_16305 [Gemmatimonadota bacterium]
MHDHLSILENIPFLQHLPIADLKRLSTLLEEKHFRAGETVFYEGSIGDALYIVKDGLLEVTKTLGNEEQSLAKIVPGEFFGEMGLLENKPRSATIRALHDSLLLRIDKSEFEHLLKDSPQLYFEVARALSGKLRETNMDLIRHLQQKNAELQKAYNDLKAAQEELVRQEKLATIGMVTSRIIHDIKNPMTSIRGFAELIAKKFPESKAFADIIVQEVLQIVDMAQELLDYARGKESHVRMELVRIPEFIEATLKPFQQTFETCHIIPKVIYDFEGEALFDAAKIRRVLSNLIANARDAMDTGGQLTIRITRDQGYLCFEVSDTGKGIPPEIQENLFEPFITYGKSHGTGLGLAIARKVVEEDHQGKIEVESLLQQGTTFRVFLPV